MQASLQKFVNRFIWNTESRSVNLENPKNPINGWLLDQALGGNVSKSGRSISQNAALTLSAVYRAVSIKAGLISSLPFQVYEKTDQGRKLANHPAADLLSRRPNDKMTKTIYFDRAMNHYELQGNHFAYIKRNGIARVEALMLEKHENVEVIEGKNRVAYKVKGIEGVVSADDMIHVPNMGDGVMGKSVIGYMREDAALMMDIRDYGESFFGNKGKPAALLIPKSQATSTQRQEMKTSFREAKMQGGEVAMPWGWEYKEISIPPKDADWVVSNDFSIATVARWFGVPTQKLGDSAVKYNNVEFMGIEFLQDTMSPIASKFENEYTSKLFMLPSESEMYAEINLDAYLRADSVSKAEQFSKYVQNGIKTPNEIRKYNNDPAMDGGDDLFIQGATVPIKTQKELLLQKKQPATRQSLRTKIAKQVKEGIDPQLIIEGLFSNDGNGY